MLLTAVVAPHDVDTGLLFSWAAGNPVNTGHWIVIRGYYGTWDGTRDRSVISIDSSAGLARLRPLLRPEP